MRLTRWLLACALVGGVFGAPSGYAAEIFPCGTRAGAWRTTAGPEFSTGGAEMTDYAVDPFAPGTLYATNGTVVERSTDGACNWEQVYALPETPGPGATFTRAIAAIKSIVVPESVAAHNRVYLLIEEGDGLRPHVVRSDDGGDTWTVADVGLPPTGSPEVLLVAPIRPQLVYLAIDEGGGSLDLIYFSEDGGTTWVPRSNLTDLPNSPQITTMEIDPLDFSSLWAGGPGGLYHSADGGQTFRLIPESADFAVGPIDVFHLTVDLPTRIYAFLPDEEMLLGSEDNGASWFRYAAPLQVDSVAHGPVANSLMVTADGGAHSLVPSLYTFQDAEAPSADVGDILADRTADPHFFVRSDNALHAFRILGPGGPGGPGPKVPKPILKIPRIEPFGRPPLVPPSLEPRKPRVVLEPGEARAVDYQLEFFRRRVPVDILFVVDVSNSMDAAIQGLLYSIEDIVEELGRAGIDVRLGLASYRSYPDEEIPRPDEPNFVYRRIRDIGPVAGFDEALGTLVAGAGGRYDAHLGALYQAMTGSGQDVYPPGGTNDVPEGKNAHFRGKSFRVVVHATDEAFGREIPEDPPTTPDIPNLDEVTSAFNLRKVEHVGLWIPYHDESVGWYSDPMAGDDLKAFSGTCAAPYPKRADEPCEVAGTATLAPPTGVDCDGDGVADIPSGAPLVCRLEPEDLGESRGLGSAIVNLVQAVPKRDTVTFRSTAGAEVVESITPSLYDNIVLQLANTLNFQVTFSCTRSQAGRSFDVSFDALRSKGVLASAGAEVVCRRLPRAVPGRPDAPEDPIPVPPVLAPEPVVAIAPPPPLAPPPPIPEIASASQSQSQAQSQAQAQAQGSVAAQEQEQPQLAFVHSYYAGAAEQEEYAFSSIRSNERGMPPAVPLGAAATVMGLAYGIATRIRVRAQHALATVPARGRNGRRRRR